VLFAGGVAHNPCVHALLAEYLGVQVIVPDQPDLVGALGAALEGERRRGAKTLEADARKPPAAAPSPGRHCKFSGPSITDSIFSISLSPTLDGEGFSREETVKPCRKPHWTAGAWPVPTR
jgi:molecular chaperone DnaK (HSP70)